MSNWKLLLSSLHHEEKGAMKQTIEAVCVGAVLVGILFTTAVMFNGGVMSIPAEVSSASVPNTVKDSPASMLNNIVNGDKVPDSITRDLSNLKGKLEDDTPSTATENFDK